MNLKPWHKSLSLVVISVASAFVAYASLSEPWYHHNYSVDRESWDSTFGEEYRFLMDKWTHEFYDENSSRLETFTYHESSHFWVPLQPMHSFMSTIEILVELSTVVALLSAVLAFLRYQKAQLISSAASIALFVSVPVAFFIGFVDACNRTDFPMMDELTSFMGDKTTTYGYSYVWGPMSGWWLLIVACSVQSVGLAVALWFRKK